MEKNSFTLRSSGEQRASTAVPVERSWNPPVRRIFSSRELTNRENALQLEDYISRLDERPSFLHDDSRLHRPFSNNRFTALRIPSAEAPGTEPIERASLPHSQDNQDNLSVQPSLHENRTDRSDSLGNEGSESHQSSPEIQSFSDIQDVIDSTWSLNRIPEQLQEGFDRMKEEIQNKTSELSKERRKSVNLSRDVEALREELSEFRVREKEIEVQLSNQERTLKVESLNVERLREENEKLKEQSSKENDKNEKTQSQMKLEIDTLSKDLEVAKRDIRFKEKFLGQIQRDVKNAKEEFDEEVKRRERAEAESNAVKQECAELQRSYREDKRQWMVLQKENEAQVTQLREVNESQREKISLLEIAVEKQNGTRQAVESDLVEMVSFLRRISRAVEHVFHAISTHGCLDAPATTELPISALIAGEHWKSYGIFERLPEALEGASSLSGVLELARPYDDALNGFFRILVVRLVAQSEHIWASDEAFKQIESCHTLIRSRFVEQRHGLQDLCVTLSSQFSKIRQETSQVTEQLCLKVKEVENEKERVKLELQVQKDKGCALNSLLGKFKESLSREKTILLELKKHLTAHSQELRRRNSKDATDTSCWYETLEEVKSGIESLCTACSAVVEEHENVKSTLQADLKCLRTELARKETKIKELTEIEADLLQAKNELSSHSRQAIADEEERERHTASLQHDIERLETEKNEAVNKLAAAEHALQEMSGRVTEALNAKQEALEALIHEKSVIAQLRSELREGSSKRQEQPSHQPPAETDPRPASSTYLRNEPKAGTDEWGIQIQEPLAAQSKCSPLPLIVKRPSSAKTPREYSEADPCDVDFVPKKKKKRTSISHPRKSPRQRTTRIDVSKSTTAGKRAQLQNPKEGSGLKESVGTAPGMQNTSSKSGTGRDEEWDIELVFGKAEE